MKQKSLPAWLLLLTATVVYNTQAFAQEKFDTDPKHQLPKPDTQPADLKKPVKVFILMGQSNMLGATTANCWC